MPIIWNEKTNSRSDLKDIKFNHGDTVDLSFNTRLIPNSLLRIVKGLEGKSFSEAGWDLKFLSILIEDGGNKTLVKYFVSRK